MPLWTLVAIIPFMWHCGDLRLTELWVSLELKLLLSNISYQVHNWMYPVTYYLCEYTDEIKGGGLPEKMIFNGAK